MLISEDDFDNIWEPQINPFGNATDAYDWEYKHLANVPLHQVWSLVDGDDGGTYAIPGYHVVNVFGYVVTARMWTDEEAYMGGLQAVWSEPHCGECGLTWDPAGSEPNPLCEGCGNCPDHHDEECDDGYADGKVLIAGILYDRETGQEADPQ